MAPRAAPPWQISEWFNTPEPLSLESLHGRVILLEAFQMRCRACVRDALPQAMRVAKLFAGAPLVVVGLHTVFENHEAQRPEALQAFLREQDITFPVGVDVAGPEGDLLPRTMRAYDMRGTPTTVLIDAQGRRRRQVFGAHEDLLLGAELQALLSEV